MALERATAPSSPTLLSSRLVYEKVVMSISVILYIVKSRIMALASFTPTLLVSIIITILLISVAF